MLEARLAEARSIGQHRAADITDTACVVSRLCVDGNSLAQHLEYQVCSISSIRYATPQPLPRALAEPHLSSWALRKVPLTLSKMMPKMYHHHHHRETVPPLFLSHAIPPQRIMRIVRDYSEQDARMLARNTKPKKED